MKKKILHVIHGLNMGGAETVVKNYCLGLDRDKYDLVVLCFTRENSPYDRQLQEAGIRVIYLMDEIEKHEKIFFGIARKIYRHLALYYYTRKAIRTEKPDVIHSHLMLNRYIAFANPAKGTKIFHTVHAEPKVLWNGSFRAKREAAVLRRFIRKYDFHFIALHENMCKEMNEMFSVSNSLVLNNGIDFTPYDNPTPRATVRSENDIPQDAFVIGHVGRFSPVKNHAFLLQIFEQVCKQKENAFLLMIGAGSLIPQVQQMAQEMGLADRIRILTDRTDIPDLLMSVDAFAFPSRCEGLGIALIEAQRAALPCVASASIPDGAVISNLVTRLSLQEKPEIWADALLQGKPEKTEYYSLEDWDLKAVIRKLESFYDC